MGAECSTCQNCKQKDEIQINEVRQVTHPQMNSYSQQPNEKEDADFDLMEDHQRNQVQFSQQSEQKEVPQIYMDSHHSCSKSEKKKTELKVQQMVNEPNNTPDSNQTKVVSGEVGKPYVMTGESNGKDKESVSKKLSQYQPEYGHDTKGVSDQREKRPPFQFKSGAQYDGEWKGNLRDGFGIQICNYNLQYEGPDGAKYEGEWRNNKANGKGKFWHVDGDYFEGEWKDDKANGFGIYVHTNGAKYEGDWKDDLQDGYGIETWTDGSRYEGYYVQGKKQGFGIYHWNDGSKYQGQWFENKIQGFGVYTWLDGRMYEGFWMNNTMNGRGRYSWKDGRKYEGEYYHDKKHGYGIYVWNDGRGLQSYQQKVYEGFWMDGKQNGKGRYILPDGTRKLGLWEDGRRIRWIEGEENTIIKPSGWDDFSISLFQNLRNADD